MKFLYYACLLVLTTTINVICQEDDEYETISVEIQLADFDLSDAYDDIAAATKYAVLGHGFKNKTLMQKDSGILIRQQSARNREFEGDVPYEFQRNWTLITNVGDMLIPQENYSMLIDFHNENEELSSQTEMPCISQNTQTQNNNSNECVITKQDYIDILASNRNLNYLNETWQNRQSIFDKTHDKFNSTLQLTNKAFLPNEEHNARSYWEMLSEYPDGYTKAQALWEEVQPLYKKLHNFVKIRLERYYKLTQNSATMPVYLLGTNFGNDWSNIADIVLPHPYLYNEVLSELKYQTVKHVYRLGENATRTMGFKLFGKQFWSRSDFNYSSCGPYVFSSCRQHYSEVITCPKLGWTEYLDIHEASIDIALRNQDYSSLPRRETRFSAIDEALKNLGSIIAINNLPLHDFIPKNAFHDENDKYNRKNTALLLVALRVLPKLPYYLLADLWRLDELEFSYGNFTEAWWKYRNNMQLVKGNNNSETDFLGDSFITSNKPHLSKFLGVFLQFQILDYYERFFAAENSTITDFIKRDENFIPFVNDRPNKDWVHLMSYHMGIDDISSTPLLEYFRPLEKYLEEAPLDQIIISTTPKPRTTKTTTVPVPKRPKSTKTPPHKLPPKNQTDPLTQNDEPNKNLIKKTDTAVSVEDTTEASNINSASSEKKYVLIGIGSFLLVGIVIILIVRRLRRKQRTNNRRFQT